ncbi:MAG TPA: hypothetical protein V6D17_13160 [Candidatus Obscuribacterales bacterium]
MEHVNSPLAGVEQILLIIFMLMVFVGIAGGNPSMVLKPVFEIIGQILMALISLLTALITTLFRVVLSVFLAAIQSLAAGLKSNSSRQIK